MGIDELKIRKMSPLDNRASYRKRADVLLLEEKYPNYGRVVELLRDKRSSKGLGRDGLWKEMKDFYNEDGIDFYYSNEDIANFRTKDKRIS
ncbi:MAG: hypothetical protein AABW52_04280, partial [Nanoarchaeota archaeon]